MIGDAGDCYEITNCHSSAIVYSNGGAGSLCGGIHNGTSNNKTIVSNCSSSGTVYGRGACGGLIGDVYGNVEVRNCYSSGNVNVVSGNTNDWYRGGLIGNFMFASAYNCYSIGNVEIDSSSNRYYGKVIGCPYLNTPFNITFFILPIYTFPNKPDSLFI